MVLERDQLALEFIEKFRLASSRQVSNIAYHNIDVANRRLKKFTKDKLLYRIYNPIQSGYVYSVNPIRSVKQIKHTMLRNEFHFKLLEMGCEIETVEVEPLWGSIRPDAVYILKYQGKRYAFLLEVEMGTKSCNTKKYNDFWLQEYKGYLKMPIPVVYVTRNNINNAKYDYKKVDLSLRDIDVIFK